MAFDESAFMSASFSGGDDWAQEVEAKRSQLVDIPQPNEDGGYETPLLSAVLEAWELFEAEDYDDDDVLEVLGAASKILSSQLSFLESVVKEGRVQDRNPFHEAVHEGLKLQLSGVRALTAVLKGGSEDADAGFDQLAEGTDQVVGAYAEFQQVRLELLTFHCPSCGERNTKGQSRCVKCHAMLPREAANSATAKGQEVTCNYLELESAFNKWKERREAGHLTAVIERVQGRLAEHARAQRMLLKRVARIEEADREWMRQSCAEVEQALSQSQKALEMMAADLKSENPAAVEQGLSVFRKAGQQLVGVYQAQQAAIL